MDASEKNALELAMATLIQGGRDIDTMTDAYFDEIERRAEERYQLEPKGRRPSPR